MAKVNQVSFKSIRNQKVTVEELIDGELKGIVGGVVSSYTSEVNTTSTDGTNSSIVDSTQEIVDLKNKTRTRKIQKTTILNGVAQSIASVETSPI
ncbi:hypothetical protein NIES2100_67350 [Calothrix sp. NIES-2100]|uniref:hypothetical protein n=1 Tax=Calothrix sp. NIES-2100 TaxID=1954172 RepID=UPI000B5DF13E|nr:hypothetical protein NIES2100_67350 [Calothrix sp. NIES-2100]